MPDKTSTVLAIVIALIMVGIFFSAASITGLFSYHLTKEKILFQGQEITFKNVFSVLKQNADKVVFVFPKNLDASSYDLKKTNLIIKLAKEIQSHCTQQTITISTTQPIADGLNKVWLNANNQFVFAYLLKSGNDVMLIGNLPTLQNTLTLPKPVSTLLTQIQQPTTSATAPLPTPINQPVPGQTTQVNVQLCIPMFLETEIANNYKNFIVVSFDKALASEFNLEYIPAETQQKGIGIIMPNGNNLAVFLFDKVSEILQSYFDGKTMPESTTMEAQIASYAGGKTYIISSGIVKVCEPGETKQQDLACAFKPEKLYGKTPVSIELDPKANEYSLELSMQIDCSSFDIKSIHINNIPMRYDYNSVSKVLTLKANAGVFSSLEGKYLTIKIEAECDGKDVTSIYSLGKHYFQKLLTRIITGSTYYYLSSYSSMDAYGNDVYTATYEDDNGNNHNVSIVWNGANDFSNYLNDLTTAGFDLIFNTTYYVYEIINPTNPAYHGYIWQSTDHVVYISSIITTGTDATGLFKTYLQAYPTSLTGAITIAPIGTYPLTPLPPSTTPTVTVPISPYPIVPISPITNTIFLVPRTPQYFSVEVNKLFTLEFTAINLGSNGTFGWDLIPGPTCSLSWHNFIEPARNNQATINTTKKVEIKTEAKISNPGLCKISYTIFEIGNPSNNFTISFTIYAYSPNQITLSLKKGFNLISFPFYMDMSFTDFNSLAANAIASIWGYSPATGWQIWHSNPAIPSTPGFDHFEPGYAYWINATTDIDVVVTSTKPTPTIPSIYVNQGWNLLGLALPYPIDISSYLKTMFDKCEAVYQLDPITKVITPIAKTTTLMPGQGYWFYFNESGVIVP